MRRALTSLAMALLLAGAWFVHRTSSRPPLNLDDVARSAKAACAPMEIEGARTDGRTYFTFTCQREVDLGVCRPAPRGRVAPAPVTP